METLQAIETRLNYEFQDKDLLIRALTHKSSHNENVESSKGHNEVLEFLGDAVLGLVLAEELISTFPKIDEGDLSRLRASLVSEPTLAEMALQEGLSAALRLGKGERLAGGQLKPRLMSSVFEAVVGAIFSDGGFDSARRYVTQVFRDRLSQVDPQNLYFADHKTRLQERLQETKKKTPIYEVLREEGPDHEKTFHVKVSLGSEMLAEGQGRSKKQAEQEAARKALENLK